MDPLGRGAYAGEWVPLAVVGAFAWTTRSGLLYAAATRGPSSPTEALVSAPPPALHPSTPALLGPALATGVVELSVPIAGARSLVDRLGSARLRLSWRSLDRRSAPAPAEVPATVGLAELRALVTLPSAPAATSSGSRSHRAPTEPLPSGSASRRSRSSSGRSRRPDSTEAQAARASGPEPERPDDQRRDRYVQLPRHDPDRHPDRRDDDDRRPRRTGG